MFDSERYLDAILSQSDGKGELAELVLSAEVVKDSNSHTGQKKIIGVLDGLREYASKHVLLLGKPGSGKSTTIKQLLRAEAKKCQNPLEHPEHPIPVLIELRRLEGKIPFDDAIYKLVANALSKPRPRSIKPEDVTNLLYHNKFLLLIDGLNELPPNVHRLADWRNDFIGIPMIFTSRELGTESYLGITNRLQIQPLNDGQINDFINKKLGGNSGLQLKQALNYRLREITDNPMLLGMLCKTFQKSSIIPKNQGELFRQFTHDEYEKHKPKGSVVPRHDVFFDFCDDFLQELAFFMMDAKGNAKNFWLQIERRKAQEHLEKYFERRGESNAPSKVDNWLDDALNFHLLQHALDQNKIEFAHQLFQEYYAAEWLLHHLDEISDDELSAHYLNSIKWTESVFMLMDLMPEKLQAELIINQALNVDITLAAKLSGRTREEWQKDIFNILYLHLKEKQLNEYIFAKIIRFNQTKYAAEHIVEFLDENKFVSVHSISEGEWGKLFFTVSEIECVTTYKYTCNIIEEDFPQIISIIINDGNIINIKLDGKETDFTEKRKLELTEKYIQKDRGLFEIIENPIIGSSSSIQWEAMLNLWRWGKYEDFLNKLHYFLWPRPLSESEHQYLEILYYSDMSSKASLFNIIDFPSKYINSRHMDVESQWALEILGEKGIYQKLSMLRRVSIEAIVKFTDDQVAEKLIDLLGDKDLAVACFSAEKLGYLPESSVKEQAFIALLSITKNAIISKNNNREIHISNNFHNSEQLFYNSTDALARLDQVKAGNELLGLLDTLNDSQKPMCIDALTILSYEKAIPQLISLSKSNSLPIKKSAIKALGIIGSKNEVQHLLQILQNDGFEVKQNSIESLDKILKKGVDEEILSLTIDSLFLELDTTHGMSEAIFKEYKDYQNIFNLPLDEQDRSKIFSQECDTNSSQYAKYAQYIHSILATLEYIATKYANHSICLRIIGYTFDAISTNKNVETRSLMLNLLGQIPHYNAIEKWLDNAKHDEKYISEWSELINRLSYGGSSWPSVYPSAYKYPQEMACQFTSESEKNKFNLAIDNLETFHNQYRRFYRVGMEKTEGEHTSYASEFCKKENIESKFLEITNENSNKRNINNISSILNHCPDYWPRLIDWASHHDNELHNQLSILYGTHECKSGYIDDAFSLLKNQQFNWKGTLVKEIEKFPKCLGVLSSLALHDYDFLRILRRSQNYHGYYSYEWFEKSKTLPKYSSIKEANMTVSTINFNAPITVSGTGNTLTGDVTTNHNYKALPQVELCPLILTEGKTDWKHLEFALNKLQTQGKFSSLKVEFSKAEEHMGYAQMLQYCQALSKSPQNRLHICIFDRDEGKVNSEFKVKNNSDKAFVYYGNNVFITRIPQIIDTEDKISIENYYSNNDLERPDSQGRRLPRAGFKVINNQKPEDLSKNDFADNIRKETHEFKDVDVSNFAKIFELIETIITEAKKPK